MILKNENKSILTSLEGLVPHKEIFMFF
jgi:hypothetical protein